MSAPEVAADREGFVEAEGSRVHWELHGTGAREAFAARTAGRLPAMRQAFFDRFKDRIGALERLTRAQDSFFESLEANLAGYRAIRVPALVLAGAEDRAIPPSVRRKIAAILPDSRYEEVPGSGHVVYLERPDLFWDRLRRFARTKSPV